MRGGRSKGRLSSGETRVVVGGYATDSDGKSNHGRRTLAVDPVTVQALREYVQRWEEWKRGFGHDGAHLFCHPDGRPIHPDTITDWFGRLSWEAGLPPIRPHDVRHSYATAALRAGVPVKVVSERLGHSSVAFTQDTYMHVIPGMDEHSARVAATAILGPAETGSDGAVTTHVTIGAGTPLAGSTEHARGPLTVLVRGPLDVGSGGRIRTYDLWVMSRTGPVPGLSLCPATPVLTSIDRQSVPACPEALRPAHSVRTTSSTTTPPPHRPNSKASRRQCVDQ